MTARKLNKDEFNEEYDKITIRLKTAVDIPDAGPGQGILWMHKGVLPPIYYRMVICPNGNTGVVTQHKNAFSESDGCNYASVTIYPYKNSESLGSYSAGDELLIVPTNEELYRLSQAQKMTCDISDEGLALWLKEMDIKYRQLAYKEIITVPRTAKFLLEEYVQTGMIPISYSLLEDCFKYPIIHMP